MAPRLNKRGFFILAMVGPSCYHTAKLKASAFMNTRKIFTYAAVALLAALCPLAFGQESADKDDDNVKFPSRGVRFVVCSPSGERLPTPLYAKVGETHLPVHITSRAPSPRLAPNSKGNIAFYDKDPGPKAKGAQPLFTIEVPQEHRTKSICVVQPAPKNAGVSKAYFFKESTFPKGSSYIVNLSSSTLEMVTSSTGKFEGEEKRVKIAPNNKKTSLSADAENVWGFSNSKASSKLYFSLSALPADAKGSPIRIKSSTIMTYEKNTQLSFVVEHPTLKGSFRIMSVQYADLDKIKPAPPGKAPDKP